MTTNEFERDLNDQAGLKRPGRIDLRVFQNTADAGDGHPGLQRAFRNYLHEGGIEKDIQLLGFSILGDSVDINNAELQQLSNIGGTTISAAQWVFVGQADQDVRQADSPTFANLNLADDIIHVGDTNNLISFGTDTQDFQTGGSSRMDISDSGVRFGGANVRITGVINNDSLGTSDVVLCTQGNVKAYADIIAGNLTTHEGSTGESHTYIDQSVVQSTSPTFVGLILSADVVTTSTFDSVDVGDFKTSYDNHLHNTQTLQFDGINSDGGSFSFTTTGDITFNSKKLMGIADPTLNQDASTKIYVDGLREGNYSDDLVFSNDDERYEESLIYVKLKEINVYRHIKLKVYWESKYGVGADEGSARIYINGVGVGSEHALTGSYQSFTENIQVRPGDKVQIYGYAKFETITAKTVYARYQRIKFIEYTITGGY